MGAFPFDSQGLVHRARLLCKLMKPRHVPFQTVFGWVFRNLPVTLPLPSPASDLHLAEILVLMFLGVH